MTTALETREKVPYIPEGLPLFVIVNAVHFKDSYGRPLGEIRAGETSLQGVPMELKTCPYPGVRYHHTKPMNVSALQRIYGHKTELLSGLTYLRNHVHQGSSQPTLAELTHIALLGESLPNYLVYRSKNPVYGDAISEPIAAIHKACGGLTAAFVTMWERTGYSKKATVTKNEILDFAEKHALFVGANQVCSAPQPLIEECLDAIIDAKTPSHATELTSLDLGPAFSLFGKKILAIHVLDAQFIKSNLQDIFEVQKKMFSPVDVLNACKTYIKREMFFIEAIQPLEHLLNQSLGRSKARHPITSDVCRNMFPNIVQTLHESSGISNVDKLFPSLRRHSQDINPYVRELERMED